MGRTVVRGKKQGANPDAPKREIDEVVAAIKKEYGDLSVFMARDKRQPLRLSTGIFTLDLALAGGIPVGKFSLFHGPRSSGKTTAALLTVAEAQRRFPDMDCVFIDIEHAFDGVWAEKLGVDLDRLIIVQPASGEEAADFLDAFMHAQEVCLIIVDSIAAMTPMREIDASAEDAHVGIHAKLVTGMVRKMNSAFVKEFKRGHKPTVLAINQQRSKIGARSPHGNEVLNLPGGKALEFFTGVQTKFANLEKISRDAFGNESLEYNEHSFRVDKNKFNAGIRAGEFILMRRPSGLLLEAQIDDAATMLAFAKKHGIYNGGGSSWKLELNDEIHQFRKAEEAANFLYENREVHHELRNHLMALHAASLGMKQDFLDAIYEM